MAPKVAFNSASEASYVYYLSGQKFIKNAQNCQFLRLLRLLENLKLAVKQCYQTGHFWKDTNWWKMPELKNSNATFCAIFKHCEIRENRKNLSTSFDISFRALKSPQLRRRHNCVNLRESSYEISFSTLSYSQIDAKIASSTSENAPIICHFPCCLGK